MQEPDDKTLLRGYVEDDSQEAFAALVTRHVNKVYSVALRHTRNPHQAEEITQAVFTILARKSHTLGKSVVLSGWLYETARLTALTFVRSEIRRARRQREALMQNPVNETESEAWLQMAPQLDAAMAQLSEMDRHAVVLRFFDGKGMREIGAALGLNEEAAKKRVARAVERLRLFLLKRGVALSASVVAATIAAHSVQAAPPALAKTAAAVAATHGATASGSTLVLIKQASKVMAWTKAKVAVVVGSTVLLAAGTTTTVVVRHEQHLRSQTEFPRSTWGFAGNADPASALKTVVWAESLGDGRTLLANMTPELQEQLRQRYANELKQQGVSLEEIVARKAKAAADKITGFYIWGRQVVSNQVLLRVWLAGEGRNATFKMRQVGGEWKLDEQFSPDY